MNVPDIVEVVLDIAATGSLPPGFEWPLYRGIVGIAPWLGDSAHAGILPLRGTRLADGALLLARRAKLVIRMPHERICAASALEGRCIDLGGPSVTLGQGTFRKLRPSPTVYSPCVALGEADERVFGRRLAGELKRLRIDRPFLCGRRVDIALDNEPQPAYGVAVHGLDEEQSLLLQASGLGRGHAVGCGLFVPHKAIGVAP